MMSRLSGLALIFTAVLAGAPSLAQSADVDRGRQQASHLCSDCHAVGPLADPGAARVGPPFSEVAKTKGMTAMALSVWLQTSHPTMPNIMLTPETREDIIAYILSLRRTAH